MQNVMMMAVATSGRNGCFDVLERRTGVESVSIDAMFDGFEF